MNKLLIMLFSLLTVVMLSSCDEVKDSPILFKATSNTNPEYISVSYYPEEIGITFYPKVSKYFIYSYTYIDGDLELTCTNCDNINYSLDCSFGIVKNNVGKDISATEEEVGVSVKNTDNKTLRIHFAKLYLFISSFRYAHLSPASNAHVCQRSIQHSLARNSTLSWSGFGGSVRFLPRSYKSSN